MATGLTDLDHLTGGLLPGTLTVIAGYDTPALDATAVALTVNISVEGHPVIYASARSNQTDLALRFATASARVPFASAWRGRLSPDGWKRLDDAADRLRTLPILLLDGPWTSSAALHKTIVTALASQPARPAVLVVEHLRETLQGHPGRLSLPHLSDEDPDQPEARRDDRHEDVEQEVDDPVAPRSHRDSFRSLDNVDEHGLAGLLDLASNEDLVVVAIERTRWPSSDRTDRRPTIADLPEADLLVEQATTMVLIHDDAVSDPASPDRGTIEANVVVNRYGPLGMVRLAYHSTCGLVADLEPDRPAGNETALPRHEGTR